MPCDQFHREIELEVCLGTGKNFVITRSVEQENV